MGVANLGNQEITFKYSTPLKADYLNIMFNSVSSEGLCTRPLITVGEPTSTNVHIWISPFSMVVHPLDDSMVTGEDNKTYSTRMVKISTTSNVELVISKDTVAVAFEYRLEPESGSGVSQWYGDFKYLTADQATSVGQNCIIVATCMFREINSNPYFSVSTQGADISDLLLKQEGWDCNRWVSLISPRRLVYENGGYYFNKLELRKHNDAFEGYVNGHAGCVHQGGSAVGAIPVSLPLPEFQSNNQTSSTIITNNDWGVIQEHKNDTWNYTNYILVKHNSDGLNFAQQANDFPIEHTDGGILAIVNATKPNQSYGDSNPVYADIFANQLRIIPCVREEINMYLSDDSVLMIR